MNRREFLHSMSGSILVTAMSVAQARAQSHNASASEDIVFADFESGNYDDWTLTGDCWTNTPASAFRFPKVTGYQGKRFLCTFHPTLGNAATGKAVSKEFTMDKPFINFLIGGGNYPHKACLNLVLGAEVVRTATGSNSTELRQAWWDVTPFLGKKAHLEVVDDTTSQDRGYIMVDDIRFSQFKRGKQALENEPEPAVTPERPPLREAVLRFCRQRVGVQVGDGECGTLVIQALASAGARPRQADFPESGDYVWGVLICTLEAANGMAHLKVSKAGKKEDGSKGADIRPGDVIQFRDVEFRHPSGIGFFTRTYPHHSAIIREVSEDGQVLDIFEQNYGGKRYVVESTLDLEELAQGWLRIYRPQ